MGALLNNTIILFFDKMYKCVQKFEIKKIWKNSRLENTYAKMHKHYTPALVEHLLSTKNYYKTWN